MLYFTGPKGPRQGVVWESPADLDAGVREMEATANTGRGSVSPGPRRQPGPECSPPAPPAEVNQSGQIGWNGNLAQRVPTIGFEHGNRVQKLCV